MYVVTILNSGNLLIGKFSDILLEFPSFIFIVNYRFFKKPIHNDLVEIVIKRVKYMLGYSETSLELVHPQSVLYRYVNIFYFVASIC